MLLGKRPFPNPVRNHAPPEAGDGGGEKIKRGRIVGYDEDVEYRDPKYIVLNGARYIAIRPEAKHRESVMAKATTSGAKKARVCNQLSSQS